MANLVPMAFSVLHSSYEQKHVLCVFHDWLLHVVWYFQVYLCFCLFQYFVKFCMVQYSIIYTYTILDTVHELMVLCVILLSLSEQCWTLLHKLCVATCFSSLGNITGGGVEVPPGVLESGCIWDHHLLLSDESMFWFLLILTNCSSSASLTVVILVGANSISPWTWFAFPWQVIILGMFSCVHCAFFGETYIQVSFML